MIVLLVIGCNTQETDTQGLSQEPAGNPPSAAGTSEPASTAGTTQPSPDEPNEELDDQETSERKNIKFMEKRLALFWAEPVDSTWAAATQSVIQGELDKVSVQLPATVRAGTVECRQRTCLVEILHNDESTLNLARPLLSRVHLTAKSRGRVAMAQHRWKNPDGSIIERVYFYYKR